jgi:low temperature requirement protein LtrA
VSEDEQFDRDGRDAVVPLELFFDLVFVFAFAQVSALIIHDLTWGECFEQSWSSVSCGGLGRPTPG